MKVLIIANPHAGGKRCAKLIDPVHRKIKEMGCKTELLISEYHGHIPKLCQSLSPEQYDSIAILGGDGTNYEVVNGLLSLKNDDPLPPLAVIPVGSGNSFARDLNIFTTDDGLSALSANQIKNVDVCSFSQMEEIFYFVNLMGFGFVTDVAATADKCKFLGDTSYLVGIFHRLLRFNFHSLHMEVDGKEIAGENCFVEICNSRYTGGSMMMAPDASIEDGLMDVVICDPLSRRSLVATLPKIYKGTHGENKAVRFMKARHISIETEPSKTLLPDGELFGVTPTEISIIPGKVRYFVK